MVSDPPTAQPPVTSLIAGVQASRTAEAVRVFWPAATDPHSPIASYQLQASKNGGSWGGTVSTPGSTPEARYTLAFDATYRFRVRAMDAAGNWSPWAEAVGTSRIHAYDDRSSVVEHKKSWSRTANSSAYASTLSGATAAGAKVAINFTGHSVALMSPKSPHLGKAKIYIDGTYIGTISLRTSTATSRQVVFARYFPAGGAHRLAVVAVGGGTYPLVRLDAFVVSR